MNKTDVIGCIVSARLIAVIRAPSSDEAVSIIEPIAAGGISIIEITMTVPGAVELIAKVTAERNDLLVGAGTVLDPETAGECIDAGAKFIVSPATNFDTIQYCKDKETVVIPGALTPTEIGNAWDAGADLVKVFPTDSMGGAKYIRSLKVVLPNVKMIVTGGVSFETAADLIRAGAEAVGVGADLVNLQAVREGRTHEITQVARNYVEIVTAAQE